MKHFVKFIVVTFFILISTNSYAEQKIVILDLTYVLNNSKAGKDAQDFLKKSFKDNTKKFADMEKNLKKEENDLLSKKTVLTKEDFSKKADELRKKVIDYQTERRTSLDKIATQRAKSRETLLKTAEPILQAYISENNISLVIDKKFTLGGNPENDITKVIVEKLNKELPSLNLK
jgi:outer membrane protein